MQTIIMSIKPKYWQQIVAGTKTVEYRKRLWQDKTATVKIIVYATAPISKIVGEFVTGNIISDRYPSLWLKTKAVGGISADDYFDYFVESPIAHAIVIKNVEVYDEPQKIAEFTQNRIKRAPQSWQYLKP